MLYLFAVRFLREKKPSSKKNLFCSSPLSRSPWRTVPFGSNVWLRSLPFALFPMCKCCHHRTATSLRMCRQDGGCSFYPLFLFFLRNTKLENGEICASDWELLSAIGMMAWWRRVKMRVREWRETNGWKRASESKKTGVHTNMQTSVLSCLLVTSWWCHWQQKFNSIFCESTILMPFSHLQSGWWMKNSSPKVVVAGLTAEKLLFSPRRRGEATSTSGGREFAYWKVLWVCDESARLTAMGDG